MTRETIRQVAVRRPMAVIPPVLALFLAFGVASAGAPPPPHPVTAEVRVTQPCVVHGHRIPFEGAGFAPDTVVHLSAYGPPSYIPVPIPRAKVTSDTAGEITGYLSTKTAGEDDERGWSQKIVSAVGLDRGGEHEEHSFDQVVLGTARICAFLDRELE